MEALERFYTWKQPKNYHFRVENGFEGDMANVWRSVGGYHICIGGREDILTGKMAVKIKWLDVRIF